MIDLAFGEFSETEAAELETLAGADPIAAKQLQELRCLKSDLKALSEIPPHQLSNDRLRDAILGQGLKPKSVFDWSWIWMPALSCVLVGGLMFGLRHRPTGDPGFVSPQVASIQVPHTDFFKLQPPVDIAKMPTVKVKPLVVAITHPHHRNRNMATRGHRGRNWIRRHGFTNLVTYAPGPSGEDGGDNTGLADMRTALGSFVQAVNRLRRKWW
jgi:hypothetical protein